MLLVAHQDQFGGQSTFHTQVSPPYPASQIYSYPPVGEISQPVYPNNVRIYGNDLPYCCPRYDGGGKKVSQNCGVSIKLLAVSLTSIIRQALFDRKLQTLINSQVRA